MGIKPTQPDPHRSVSFQFWMKVVVVAVIFLGIIVLLVYTQYYNAFDSSLINIAGRQRMLSQKISKELLLYRADHSIVQSIGISVFLFENSYNGMRYGGEVYTDLNFVERAYVPPAQDPVFIEALDESFRLWERFKSEAYGYISVQNQEQLEAVVRLSPLLLERLDTIVRILQENAEWRSSILNLFLIILIVVSTAVLLLFLRNKLAELKKTREMLETLETFLPICSNCKRIREKNGEGNGNDDVWVSIEEYISRKDSTKFTHGICPDCAKKLYPELM